MNSKHWSAVGTGVLMLAVTVNATVAAPALPTPRDSNVAVTLNTDARIMTASNTGARAAALPDTEARFAAEGLIKDAIQLRNSQMITSPDVAKPGRSSEQIFGRAHAKADEEYGRLQEKKRLLATHKLVFNGVNTKVDLVLFTQNGDVATAEVSEVTRLTYANYEDGTTPPPSKYSYPQIVQLTKGASGWEITSMESKTQGGIPPETVQRTPVRSPSTEPPSAPNAAKPSPTGDGMFTNKVPGDPGPGKSLNGSAKSGSAPGLMTTASFNTNLAINGYNYQAMMNYAYAWANDRNPNYPNYGNDCTNFVSQAVEYGGWAETGGFRWEDTAWWHQWNSYASYPWAVAQNFQNFANGSGRTYFLPYLSWMGGADIMQIAEYAPGDQAVSHTTIVTYANGSDIRVSYHTIDHQDMSIWTIYYGNSSNWVYYALRT